MNILKSIFGSRNDRVLRPMRKVADRINALEPLISVLSDAELHAKTNEFRNRLTNGEKLDALLPEAFAVVREASKRTLDMRHFDVQLIGGMVLHEGKIAEMRTGEGKTLVATLPVYLNALTGKGVHVVTVNDYLARRDSEWMGQIYKFLGMSVGVVVAGMSPEEKRAAYAADITYGTNNEYGFDYLRDNMAFGLDQKVQRPLHYALVDEVDSILIDEARTPLIISGPAEESSELYRRVNGIVPKLARQKEEEGPGDYWVDEKAKQVYLTEDGHQRIEDLLVESGLLHGNESLYDAANLGVFHHLNACLRAHALFHKDVEYIVRGDEVIIVDEFTGRTMPGRRWSDGLHQAIEAKEGVPIQAENQTLASITFQNYFRLYQKLAGMTGTADTEAFEFQQIYGLEVVVAPTHLPMIRKDMGDLVFLTQQEKYEAVLADIRDCRQRGQPALVGTTSIEVSELLSKLLDKEKIPHQVLNAKQHEREAEIIAQAGQPGTVTIATNMAGRGTDIVLGGNLQAELKGMGPDVAESELDHVKRNWQVRHEQVVAAGGLHVIGTERHESRRIDNQLRGRAARQGDPGTTRFYLSLEDDLMKRFNATMVDAFLTRFNVPDDVPIEAKMVSRAIASAQGQVEAQNFEIRKNVLKYDEVLNRQRQVIYGERQRVLHGENLEDEVRTFLDETIAGAVANYTAEGYPEEWELEQLWTQLETLYPVGVSIPALEAEAGGDRSGLSADFLTRALQDDAQAAYDKRCEELTEPVARELERQVILNVLDRKWREHLYEMDYLQEGIGLRAMAQRDPLVEYQKEGYDLFVAMMSGIKEETVGYMFHVQPTVEGDEEESEESEPTAEAAEAPAHIVAPGLEQERPRQVQYSSPTLDEDVPAHVERGTLGGGSARDTDPRFQNVSRNALCPCGSGKKFKRCHGDPRNAA